MKNTRLIILLMVSIISFYSISADFQDDLWAYYKLDTDFNDSSTNNYDMIQRVAGGIQYNQFGKMGTAVGNDATATTNYTIQNFVYGGDWTISFWINGSTAEASSYSILQNYGSGGGWYVFTNGNSLYIRPTGKDCYALNGLLNLGKTYVHVVWVYNHSGTTKNIVYINNVNVALTSGSGGCEEDLSTAYGFGFFQQGDNTDGWKGSIDEIGIWKRKLTVTEIATLYNNSNGYGYGAMTAVPELIVNSNLVNTTNYNGNTLLFTYNGTYSDVITNIVNCTLYDGTNVVNSSLNVNLTTTKTFNVSLYNNASSHLYKITCLNHEVSDSTTTHLYMVDNILPIIKSSFVNHTNYDEGDYFTLYSNYSDTNLFAYNITIIDDNQNIVANKFTENLTNDFYYNVTAFTITDIVNGTIILKVWDSHTRNKVKPLGYDLSNGTLIVNNNLNFYGEIKTIDRGKILTYLYLNDVGDRYKMKVTFEETNYNHKLYINSTSVLIPVQSDYKCHFVYDYEYWLDFESDNIKSCSVIKRLNYYELDIELYNASDDLETNSIGSLNTNEMRFYYSVTSFDSQQLAVLEDIYEVISMIPIIMLYIFLLVFGYHVSTSGNLALGLPFLFGSGGISFYLWRYYEVTAGISEIGVVFGVLTFGTIMWLFVKGRYVRTKSFI